MAGTIMPSPKFLGLDNNADPLSGGKLYTYAAGTTTPQDTYSDVGLTTPNTNPVILDSAGRATVFLSNSSYKFVLKDSDDVTIWSQDNISAFTPQNIDVSGIAGEAVSAGDVVYLSDGSGGKTAGKYYKADSDFDYASSLPQIALVTLAADANATASLRLQGSYTFSTAKTPGTTYYISASAGALATSPGTYSRIFGVAEADGFTIVFAPNPPNVAISPTFGTVTATQAFILGSADLNGIRMDLSTGTMEIREGNDSGYGPLNVGALGAKDVVTLTAGTVSAPALTTAGDTNTGLYFPGADEVAITVNGGEELKVTAAGLLPGANGGGALGSGTLSWSNLFLNTAGTINFANGDVVLTHSANTLAFSGASSGYTFDALVSPSTNGAAALGTGTVSWSNLFLNTAGKIDFNNGDVTVTHSTNTLAFAGASTAYTFADGPVRPASNDGAALGVSGTAWSDLFLASGGVINFNAGDVTITHAADSLNISGGNVGIGVTPSAWSGAVPLALQIGAGTAIGSNTDGTTQYTNSAYYNGTDWKYTQTSYALRYSMSPASGEFQWFTAPSGTSGNTVTFTERMRLTNGGNIAIGATAKLYLDGVAGTGDSYIYEESANTLSVVVGGTKVAAFTAYLEAHGATGIGITTVGTGTSTGTAVVRNANSVLYLQSSSRRFKENIATADVTDAQLDAFLALTPCWWDYTGQQNGALGFIAEDLAALPLERYGFSPLCNFDKDGVVESNRDYALIAMQHLLIQRLERKVAALEARLN